MQHEIVVIGGGPVGATLALALACSGRHTLLIEATTAATHPANDDPRTLALSAGSRLILERIGVWADIASATPIRTIHVSQRGGFGRAILKAEACNVPALGYVVPYAALQLALARAVAASNEISVMSGTHAVGVHAGERLAEIQLAPPAGRVRARLAVVADGGSARVAPAEVEVHDYGQTALVANVIASKPHAWTAYERFTPEGPVALLPRGQGYALIWTLEPEHADRLLAAHEQVFLRQLQYAFGARAGTFVSTSARSLVPLRLRIARRTAFERTLLVGNAAQTLHPVAGQGLNLGLRDAWELAERIGDAGDPGRSPLVEDYARTRRRDRWSSIVLTDGLIRLFTNDLAPLRWLRGCGLTSLDCLPPTKLVFVRAMMFGRPF